jgi:hypothetical protein
MNKSADDQSSSAKVATWCGRPVTDLGRQELLDCIEFLGEEVEKLRRENYVLLKTANPFFLLRGRK